MPDLLWYGAGSSSYCKWLATRERAVVSVLHAQACMLAE